MSGARPLGDAAPDSLGAKAAGLALAGRLGLPVPRALLVDAAATRAAASGVVPPGVVAAVEGLLAEIRASGRPPMVSIRCEAKSLTPPAARPGIPHSLLDVGLDQLPKGALDALAPPAPAAFFDSCRDTLALRLSHALAPADRDAVHAAPDALGAACAGIVGLARALARGEARAGVPVPWTLIVQEMVYGNVSRGSGFALVCVDAPPGAGLDGLGVFLPGQQGFGLVRGAWGPGERPLSDLRTLAPDAWHRVAAVLDRIRAARGAYAAVEIVLEDGRPYVLDLTSRPIRNPFPAATVRCGTAEAA